jgi:L-asparaginase II
MALKIDDGAARAAECVAAHILRGLQCFGAAEEQRLQSFLNPVIKTDAGRDAGTIRPPLRLPSRSCLETSVYAPPQLC